jgi:hypothetical protein
MRQIMIGDIIAVARSVLGQQSADRAGTVQALLDHAHIADKVMKRLGRPHPLWGNGSLLAACAAHPKPPEPFAGDLAYLEAMRDTIAQVMCWKRAAGELHSRHRDGNHCRRQWTMTR